MNKKITVLLVLIVLIGVVFLWKFYPSKPSLIVVKSDDGNAILTIAMEALPQGVRAQDIKIKKLNYNEVPAKPHADDFLAAYQFSPDGLVFKKPTKVSFTVKNLAGDSVPVADMVSKQGTEPLANQHIEINAPDKIAVITGELSHFSYAVISRSFFAVKITNPGDHFVGESFDVEGIAKVERTSYVFSEDVSQITTHTLTNNPDVWGMVSARLPHKDKDATAVTPITITDFPAHGTKIPESGELKTTGRFTCVQPGEAEFGYVVRMEKGGFEWRRKFIPDPSIKNWVANDEVHQRENFIDIAYNGDSFSCNSRATTTASSTASTTLPQLKIRAIEYEGTYIPLDQLKIGKKDDGCGCDAEHYHARIGTVNATNGRMIVDPSESQCGFGKVSEKPTVEVPK